ncbi:MAG: hypothetical protein CVV33_03235 [Methanomicrobiales archaeon HGW-Methanomicrobiales-4]|nr:MAG: hypothetical protein CVV33_03235 [Methanomicrobiales archaeon HGW-Methanomicrobiales-4]
MLSLLSLSLQATGSHGEAGKNVHGYRYIGLFGSLPKGVQADHLICQYVLIYLVLDTLVLLPCRVSRYLMWISIISMPCIPVNPGSQATQV